MAYHQIQPLAPLRPFVESIWIQEDLRNAAEFDFPPTTVLPSAKIDLLFYFGDPFVQFENDRETLLPRFFLIGQRTRPIKVAATGTTGIIIVGFYPWGAAPFFKLPMHELQNQSISLDSFMDPAGIDSITGQLLDAADPIQRALLLQRFLLGLLNPAAHDALVTQSTHEINRDFGRAEIHRLANDHHISRRQYIRRFKNSIGIGPKKFSNIVRFQKTLLLLELGFDWTRIAEKCGYYDQAHFIKEVKSFSGYSPQKLSHQPPTDLMSYFNRLNDMSHFYNTIYL